MKIKLIYLFFLLLISSDLSALWQNMVTLNGGGTTAMKVNSAGDLFFTTASYNYPTGQSAGVYRISNGSFITVVVNPTSGKSYNARTVETKGSSSVWVSFWGNPSSEQEGLYYSSNNGNSWTRTFSAGSNNNIFSIKAIPENDDVLIGTRNGVFRSTNNGLNFSPYNTGMASDSWVLALEYDANNAFAATTSGMYRRISTASWELVSGILPLDTPKTITIADNKLYVGSSKGNIYYAESFTSDLVPVYNFQSSKIMYMMSLEDSFLSYRNFFVATKDFNGDMLGPGLYSSQNNATNWTDFSEGIPDPYTVSALSGRMTGNNVRLFAGTFDNTVNGVRIYYRDFTVGINNLSSAVPEKFSLSQNFPNPFNPSTKIRFEIQNTSDVKLTIYNSLGKELSAPVNEKLNAGIYETEFNGNEYSSGVYFYKLEATGTSGTEFKEVKKMILTK